MGLRRYAKVKVQRPTAYHGVPVKWRGNRRRPNGVKIWSSLRWELQLRVMARYWSNDLVWIQAMTNCSIVYSDEAVKEVNRVLNTKEAYLKPSGGLVYQSTNDVTDLILKNFF